MKKARGIQAADLRGVSRLLIDGTVGMTDLVEAMHHNIAAGVSEPAIGETTGGITGVVYKSIREVTGLVGGGIDALLTPFTHIPAEERSTREGEIALAALNGIMGDYLAATDNPLAIPMRFRRKARPLTLERSALAAAFPRPGRKLLVLVHGLCMSDRQWTRKGHNHGTSLERELGYSVLHLNYNSGLHISTNGRAFADLLEAFFDQWPTPVEEFAILAHSLGGLVSRSAYHYGTAAAHRWPHSLGSLIFLGTPHHGAPLERVGNWIDVALQQSPYTSPLSRLGKVRSAGITDLRHGNLLDEDWEGRDRFEHSEDMRRPVPLPESVRCYAVAATLGKEGGVPPFGLPGDGFVPVDSALGSHPTLARSLYFPESRRWIGYGMNHWDLLHKPAVYREILNWLL